VCIVTNVSFIGFDANCRGAGIGGLMLASCLANMDKRKEIELDIYEAAEELTEIGAGINLWPRAIEMLTKIGLEADILKLYERANVDRCSFSLAVV